MVCVCVCGEGACLFVECTDGFVGVCLEVVVMVLSDGCGTGAAVGVCLWGLWGWWWCCQMGTEGTTAAVARRRSHSPLASPIL